MDFIKELEQQQSDGLKPIVELVCNTVKAKAYFKKGGWNLVKENLGDNYLNPNFMISDIALCSKMRDLGLPILVNVSNSMTEIQNLVNKYFNYNIVEYQIDRKAHYLHITK